MAKFLYNKTIILIRFCLNSLLISYQTTFIHFIKMISSEEDFSSEGEVDYDKVVKEIEDLDMPNSIITKLINNAVS